ncbi:MAG: CHRD domain-containing protein, partial [Aliifodinibius sp.]|nr:CHRD domain-containing protein [Fodinibius sp.]NIV16656.1 CHRD domain-containing protein [Fodinibius sp.]NIY30646.1 CHRD domain-containing protein [Fodinibius sp.]
GGNQLYRLKAKLNEQKTGGKLLGKENRFVLSPAQKALLKKGEVYINISTFDNQRGELRGNIGPMGD